MSILELRLNDNDLDVFSMHPVPESMQDDDPPLGSRKRMTRIASSKVSLKAHEEKLNQNQT